MKTWNLFLDDIRNPTEADSKYDFVVCRSSGMALYEVQDRGCLPATMTLDHDLGGDDDAMAFLKDLFYFWEALADSNPDLIPAYRVHSANPIGAKNIVAYMESWNKAYS